MILIQSGPHTYYVNPIATTILTKHNEEKSKILEKHSEEKLSEINAGHNIVKYKSNF